MKVLYVITQADGGGAQKYVLALAKRFHGTIAAGNEASRLFEDAKAVGVKTIELHHLKRSINPIQELLGMRELIQLIRKEQPDIVHLNSTKAGVLGSLIKPWVKTKIMFTAHGFIFNEPLPFPFKLIAALIEKFASLFRDHIIAVSNADRRSALRFHICSPEKISTVYNGLPPLTFLAKDEARSQLRLPQHTFVFGTIANFYKTKGLDILVQAAALLPKELIEKIQIVVIGDGTEADSLKLKVKSLKLENTFKLTGKIPNAAQYLKVFDTFILPSRKEGFPYALLEAMQAGLPIVATDVGGNREAAGPAALYCPPENPQELARLMQQIATNPDTRPRLSQAALQQSTLFTEENMLRQTERVYAELFKDRKIEK